MTGLLLAAALLLPATAGATELDPAASLTRASALRADGDLDAAAALQRAVATAHPAQAAAWLELGVTLSWSGRLDEAEAALERAAAEASPDLARAAHLMHARVTGWQGRFGEAERAWATLRADDPDDPEAAAGAGSLALARGRPGVARAAFERALALDPSLVEARDGLERADAVRRGELRVGGDAWRFGPDQPGAGAHGSARWAPAARVELRAATTRGRPLGPDLAPSVVPLHQLEAEVGVTTRGGAALRAGAMAQRGARSWQGVPLSVDLPAGPLRIGGTWRPGREASGPTDTLARIGVATTGPTWVQVQGFAWWDTADDRSQSAVVTLGSTLGGHALRLDVGATRAGIGDFGTAAVGWTSPWWGRHGLTATVDGMAGALDRVGGSISWRVAL